MTTGRPQISAKALVEMIWETRKNKVSEDDLTAQLTSLGLTPEQIAHTQEMIQFSLNRAFMETLGGIHNADYDDDPIFKASLKKARQNMPPNPGVRREQLVIKLAVGAAVLVGLFAIGVVIYYVVDLWRTTH